MSLSIVKKIEQFIYLIGTKTHVVTNFFPQEKNQWVMMIL